MNNLVLINNHELQVKEFQNQRVVTFKDVDRVHERPEGTARKNFSNNRPHFIENVDYFVVKPSDVNNFPSGKSKVYDLANFEEDFPAIRLRGEIRIHRDGLKKWMEKEVKS